MSIAEQEELLEDICNDVLGYGPLEPLLARDDIADIMVNGAATTFIEVGGKVQKTGVRFADNQQLMNICQRIVSQVGRRVDESSPICDARLPDGSRVNVIAPPLAIDGPALTIRKFKKDRLRLEQLVKFGSITPQAKTILEIIGRVRCNILISGGTGSGKTTLLNCLTGSIDNDERIITCEDSAELQLQQPHVVRLETRPPNLEGEGEITMRDLVKNCLRMRPERIIVGEVRGPEAFDLLQAMNTGHDGSMGTLHANSPREAISRLESHDHDGRLRAARQDHPRDDRRLDRRHRPGLAPARRLAQDHAHHRSARHGRRSRSRCRTSSSTRSPARTRTASSSAATARPASRARASGSAPNTTARQSRLAARAGRSPKSDDATAIRWESRMLDAEIACQLLVACWSARRALRGVVFAFMYPYISGEQAEGQARRRASPRAAPRKVATRVGRRRCSCKPQEAGRRHAEGNRDAPEGQGEGHAAPAARSAPASKSTPRDSTGSPAPSAASCVAAVVLFWHPPGVPPLAPCRRCFVGAFGLPRWVLEQADQAPADEVSRASSPTPSTSSCAASNRACRSTNACRSSRAKAPSRSPANSARSSSSSASACRLAKRSSGCASACRCPRSRFLAIVIAHPAAGRRQPVGSARQPVGRAARPHPDGDEGQGAVGRSQGLGHGARLAAARRHDHGLHARRPTTSCRCSRPRPATSCCAVGCGLDGDAACSSCAR